MRVIFNEKSVSISGNSSLLTEMENKKISIEHSCRQGHCGRCKLGLISGSVRHTDTLIDLKPGEILACCSTATTDIKVVTIN